ncbi:MAG: histidine phosphatase family protein [Firmicutes bacterium]|nr:histidine phosphatase family protein [Bacillota bacterium]
MKSYIVLIRHGTTEGIVNHWYYGWADLHVVQEGYDAIDLYKSEGAYPEIPADAKFYVTPLVRTKETLHHLFGDVPYEEIEEMKEINFGDWECKTFEELEKLPGAEEWLNDGNGTFCFPGGESMNGYMARISRGNDILVGKHHLTELAHRHDGRDAVSVMVCHGGAISATMMHWFPGVKDNFWLWTPKSGLGYIVYFENGEPVSYEPLVSPSAGTTTWRDDQEGKE